MLAGGRRYLLLLGIQLNHPPLPLLNVGDGIELLLVDCVRYMHVSVMITPEGFKKRGHSRR